MYITYILFSERTGKFYTGHCEDMTVRLQQHNTGRNISTRTGAPWIIVFSKESQTRSEVMILEEKIKKRGAKRFLNDQNLQIG